ncbi:16S rRNA (guanine527-N7)-methyltransferase [Novosphingobium hassiacum]|uniref:Ribosomal RNA small subunit methyltransferase G n=1 Tax=Novosphingobium hassiacum TaxID=173676 RepID=A0A7W6EVN0_9SPHN|nr:16S rRNA (guanine(527)-N(7))-methyltransferase RsmG [Novosphingobium hassiacum]MBB3859879.1 16S rRNA (guanine527-N7)-methyltransferase [Novosphingobium hassiacum]
MTVTTEAEASDWLKTTLGIDPDVLSRLDQLAALLLEENARQNLVAQGTLLHVWQRHIVDSAQLLHVPRKTLPGGEWLDLGTGAGFPGLVIAALQPERQVTVVDSRRLRTDWLSRAASALSLDNVRVIHGRVEELETQVYSVISARAFAPLEKLLTVSARFSTPDTLWLLPKGAGAPHELAMLSESWRHTFHVEQSLTDPAAGIIVGSLLGTPRPKGTRR